MVLGEIREQLQAAFAGEVTVERELGGGGMSRVFLATERAFNRPIVIKTLPPELSSAVGLERFRLEIEVAARLQHPHIVPLIRAGVAAGGPYYTMPYVEGESLRERLTREGALPVRDVIKILREVADALAYAHGRGVVHRDIKPENILIANRHALVTDFGVAKAFAAATRDGAGSSSTITQLGVTVGTPAYMAPEQVSADPDIDHRADLYSLGIVGYEMLVGAPPFAGMAPGRILAAHLSTPPGSIHETRPAVPGSLVQLINRCLAKSPADRPGSAKDVWDELETIGAQGVVRRQKPGRRVKVVAAAALAISAILVSVVFVPPEVRAMVKRLAQRSPAVLRPNRVIVNPFRNETGDTTLDHFGDYAAAQVANALSGLNRFEVVDARSATLNDSIMKAVPMLSWFRGANRAIAEQTGASVVVAGTIMREGDSLRIQTRINDFGSDAIRRPLPDVVGPYSARQALVAELTRRVFGSLAQASDTNVAAPLGSYGDPPSIEAYEAMKKGFLAYVTFNPEFAAHYRRAEALDSDYVTPIVLLAVGATFRDQRPAAESALVRARRLSHRMTPAEASLLDHVEANLRADRNAVFRTAQHMVSVLPGSFELPLLAAGASLVAGEPAAAVTFLERTDPDRGLNLVSSYYWRNLGEARHQLGDHRAALEVFRAGLARFPGDTRLAEWEATELVDLDRDVEIESAIERGRTDSARTGIAAGAVDALIARGRAEAARALAVRWLERLGPHTSQSAQARLDVARIHAAAGRWDDVRRALRPVSGRETVVAREAMTLDAIAALRRGDEGPLKHADSVLAAVTDRLDYGRAFVNRARLAALKGDRRRAEQLLSSAMLNGYGLQFTTWPIERDPWLVLFRDTEWFNARLTRLKFGR